MAGKGRCRSERSPFCIPVVWLFCVTGGTAVVSLRLAWTGPGSGGLRSQRMRSQSTGYWPLCFHGGVVKQKLVCDAR